MDPKLIETLGRLRDILNEAQEVLDGLHDPDWGQVLDPLEGPPPDNDTDRDVSKRTVVEQIERLAKQRNSLWELLERVTSAFPDGDDSSSDPFGDALYDLVQKIVGNPYAIEGVHPLHGDVNEDVPSWASAPYMNACNCELRARQVFDANTPGSDGGFRPRRT